MFSVHIKWKAGVFKFLGLKGVSEKLRFRDELPFKVGQTVEIKLRFQILLCNVEFSRKSQK